ncbi:MAG: hypothetical protein K2J24_01865 [Muribaculaceae bacterium]|nr:hypothetical protein [Muribaculaceae bacterium]
MKTKNYMLLLIVSLIIASCSFGKGDVRNRNLEQTMLARFNSISNIQYVGMSDIHELDGDRFQTVIIYYITDSIGNRTEHNARVTTNDDCSEIYTWEDLDSNILSYTKRMVSDKLEEKEIGLNINLIDALIELKKR